MEIWKMIPNHEGYEVSNFGEIRSYYSNSGKIKDTFVILKQITTEKSYKRVALRKNKKQRIWFTHRIVLLSFCGKSNLQVNHKNGIKEDNRLENLEYVTGSQNVIHAFKNNLKTSQKGETHGRRKLSNEDVFKIRNEEKGLQKDIAKKYGVSRGMICLIKNNKNWTHI